MAPGHTAAGDDALRRVTLTCACGEMLATWNGGDVKRIVADILRAKHPEIAREVTKTMSVRRFINMLKVAP